MSDVDLVFRATLDGSGFSSGASGIISQLGMMGSAAGAATVGIAALAAGVIAAGVAIGAAVAAASSWESAMTGVARTTGLAGEDLKGLSDELIAMSQQMPTAASELASIAQVAGSLGVAKENIAGFTEVVAKMAVGFEMSAEQAATSSAKILTAFGQDITAGNMEKLGNTVNRMGDSYAATETQVLDFTSRASILNTTFGLSIPQVAAWGTALISSGMEAENAATGINSMMNMALDPKKFDAFAKAAGMSTQELRERLNKDVAGTFELVAKNIASGTDSVANFQTVTDLVGTEGMKVFQKMAGATYQGAEALALANAEWETGTSLTDTYNAALDDMGSQMQILKNNLYAVGVGIGDIFLPSVTKALSSINELGPGITTSLSSIAEKIRAGDIKGALDELYSGIDTGLRSIGSRIVDYFRDIDYKAIGENIHYSLHKAWDVAKSLFSALINSDASFAGIFSALGSILTPTFESIFGTMEIAAKKALIAIGDAFINAWNSIGSALYGIYNKIVGIFSDLVGAVGEAWGWIEGKLDTLKSYLPGSSSSGGAEFNAAGTPTRLYSYETGNTEIYTNPKTIEKLLASGNYRIETGTVSINSASISIASANDLRTSDALSEMYGDSSKLHVQAVGDGGWLDRNVLTPIADRLKPIDDKVNAFGDKVEKEGVIGASKEAITGTADQVGEGIDNLQDVGREGNTRTADMHEWQKSFLDRYERKYEDYESEAWNTLKGQWQTDIAQLESQKAAEAYLREAGLNDTKAAKELEKTIETTSEKTAASIVNAVTTSQPTPAPGMYSGTSGESDSWQSYYNPATGGFTGPTALYDDFVQWKALLELQSIEAERNVEAINSVVAAYREGNISLDEAISKVQNMGQETTAVADSFGQATSEADNLKSTCVEVEFSMENIAATASQIKFSRSASASPDALKQGIFETSDTDPRRGQPQMAGANAAAGGLSNAALSAMQRYLSQVANNTNRIYNGINTYGRSIFSAVQLAGTNAAAAVNANGSIINSSVNSQGGAIVGAINAGVAAIVKAIGKSKGGGGGDTMFPGSLSSGGGFWSGWSGDAGTMSYSTGGYASHPTLAIVGDSPGGEFMVPRDRVGEFVNSYMAHQQTKIDGSGMRSQLMDAIGSLNVPAIHIPVVVDIDSEAIFEAVEYAFKSISSDIRLRARV